MPESVIEWGDPPNKEECRDIGRVAVPAKYTAPMELDDDGRGDYRVKFNGGSIPVETRVRMSTHGKWDAGPVTYEVPGLGRVWLHAEGYRAVLDESPVTDADAPAI